LRYFDRHSCATNILLYEKLDERMSLSMAALLGSFELDLFADFDLSPDENVFVLIGIQFSESTVKLFIPLLLSHWLC